MLIRALLKFNVSNFLTTATSTGYLAAEGDRRFVCVLVWSQFIPMSGSSECAHPLPGQVGLAVEGYTGMVAVAVRLAVLCRRVAVLH